MKRLQNIVLLLAILFVVASCGSSKNATNLKAKAGNLTGTWTVSNISLDVPANFNVTNVFDEGPYQDFQGSVWNLTRSGNGSYTLSSGKRQDIYWSIYGSEPHAEFQFKKLNGEKPKNVDAGYRLQLDSITSNSFIAKSPVDLGNGKTGYINYTFTK